MSIFRKHPAKTVTYLECHGCNGCIYRVLGIPSGTAVRYRVEVEKGTQRFALAELSDLPEAQNIALWLLDNGAVPEQLCQKPAEVLRKQPCI